MQIRSFFSLVKAAATEWVCDDAMRLSASLAYYAIFSLAPLVLIAMAIAGIIFGEEAAREQIVQQIQQLAGKQAGNAIQQLVKSNAHKGDSLVAALVGLGVLLFGASVVFGALKNALNTIWGVTVKPGRSVLRIIQDRFLSFALVLGIGFLLLISLIISAALSALGRFLQNLTVLSPAIWQGIDFIVSLAVVTVLFAMIFKILPSVKIGWRYVWVGAVGTAFLFGLGKHLIGLYLGTSGVATRYGAAGSVIVILIWVYYSACILFLGAEFTKVYARNSGSKITPADDAMLLLDALKQKQEDAARANKLQ